MGWQKKTSCARISNAKPRFLVCMGQTTFILVRMTSKLVGFTFRKVLSHSQSWFGYMSIIPDFWPINEEGVMLAWTQIQQNVLKIGSNLYAPHVFHVVFLRFILLGTFWNRPQTILLDQEMNFKKNPIEKFWFFLIEFLFRKKSWIFFRKSWFFLEILKIEKKKTKNFQLFFEKVFRPEKIFFRWDFF